MCVVEATRDGRKGEQIELFVRGGFPPSTNELHSSVFAAVRLPSVNCEQQAKPYS